jgi:hypothetical protein
MKTMKRALRRHHRQRMIARALRLYAGWWSPSDPEHPSQIWRWARRNHDHLAVCSCWMCGNPRWWDGPPIQERRLHEAERCRFREAASDAEHADDNERG